MKRSHAKHHRTRSRRKSDEVKSSKSRDGNNRNKRIDSHPSISSDEENARYQQQQQKPRKSGGGTGNFLHIPELRQTSITPSPVNSQSRLSINRKSLREIPKDDMRLSGVSFRYCPVQSFCMISLSLSYSLIHKKSNFNTYILLHLYL